MPLFLLLVAVPIIEIALFIRVGGWLGIWPTIGIVILTAAIGTMLLRAQGVAALGELQRRLSVGEDPSATLAHGAMILVAGILLLTPGFFTDAVGFLLLTPPVRAAAIRFARSRVTQVHANIHVGAGSFRRSAESGAEHGDPGAVDGEYKVVDPDEDPPHGDSGWTRPPEVKPGS